MKAVVQTETKKLEIQDLDVPNINDNQVLVKIKANGLCTNDIRDYLGNSDYTLPRIGGHEFSGEITEIGKNVDKNRFNVGDHVVKYIIPACGECYYCKIGRENLCEELESHEIFYNENGISGFLGLSEYMAIDSEDLYKYPKNVSFEHSSFTEPLACVIHSIEEAEVELGQDVLIIGAGLMGLLHVMLAKLKGARVFVSEPREERRKLAEDLGAFYTIDPSEGNPVELLKEKNSGRGADIVFNTNENPQVADQAIKFTAKGGKTYMFSSLHPNELVPTNMGRVHSEETAITGTVSPTIKSFYQSVQLVSKGIVDVSILIDEVFSIEESTDAYEHAMKPETYKTIIKFD